MERMKPVQSLDGSRFPVIQGIEGAAQTYEAGTPLPATSGLLVEDNTDPDNIVGLAIEPASGITGNETPIVPWLPNVVFEATLDDAASPGHVLAAANRYTAYGLAESGGKYFVDENETSAVAVLVIELVDPIGTVAGRVRFVPLMGRSAFAP